jgi:cysteine-rich repeat protein
MEHVCSYGCINGACRLVPVSVCGNGRLESGEQCDDGNPWNFDGCSKACESVANETDILVNEVTYSIVDAESGRFNITFNISVTNPTTLPMRDFQVQISDSAAGWGTVVQNDIPAGASKIIELTLRSGEKGKSYHFAVNIGHKQQTPIELLVP